MSKIQFPSSLVSVDWLRQNLAAEKLVILDASVPPIMPFTSFILPADLRERSIPGALRFDYDKEICDKESHLPHMMPDATSFAIEVRKLGINGDSAVLIYDDIGVYASTRAWWMFKAMGHDNVAVLDGGSVEWFRSGGEMSADLLTVAETEGDFTADKPRDYFCDTMAMYSFLSDPSCTIVDARSEGRFYGRDPEPRENLPSGHMPGSISLPFQKVLNDTCMKPHEELLQLFRDLAVPQQTIVSTCGSGLSACILTLAADLAGYKNLYVYDGSWCAWASQPKLPIVSD
jgi:thiosulfate/3-mercaptopyruvate sulfurtransferase